MSALDKAIEALREGRPVLIYDDDKREGETDLVYPAWAADAEAIYTLRAEAGGLICFATSGLITRAIGIPWGDELLSSTQLAPLARRRLRYGDRPAFTIWVNHVGVKTGIRDEDRSLTIRRLDEVVRLVYSGSIEEGKLLFLSEFQSPGHVPILAGRGLKERRGHTELTVALFTLARLRPSAALAEMLSRGGVLSREEAERWGEKRGIPFVLGREIVERCESDEMCGGY